MQHREGRAGSTVNIGFWNNIIFKALKIGTCKFYRN
jgi:hypothetical protein